MIILLFAFLFLNIFLNSVSTELENANTIYTETTDFWTTQISTTTEKETETIYLTAQQNSYTWISDNPYHSNGSLSVQADEGYSIIVTVSKIDIDGGNRDFLLIKSGKSLDEEGEGRIFTDAIPKELKFYYNTNSVFANFVTNGLNSNNKTGYEIIFQRAGDGLITTTLNPASDINWPTASPDDSIYFMVNVSYSNKAYDDDIASLVDVFRVSVAKMASDYCSIENMQLSEAITEENVLIQRITQCPYNWVNRDACVQITFALPVFLNDSNNYELKTNHLKIMWAKLANQYLPEELEIYPIPNVDNIIKWWAIAISLSTVVFIILLFLIKTLSSKCNAFPAKRRFSDTVSMVSSKKNSELSLTPHYLQETPEFFENDYPMYNP